MEKKTLENELEERYYLLKVTAEGHKPKVFYLKVDNHLKLQIADYKTNLYEIYRDPSMYFKEISKSEFEKDTQKSKN